jgi:hypothetical protein
MHVYAIFFMRSSTPMLPHRPADIVAVIGWVLIILGIFTRDL